MALRIEFGGCEFGGHDEVTMCGIWERLDESLVKCKIVMPSKLDRSWPLDTLRMCLGKDEEG